MTNRERSDSLPAPGNRATQHWLGRTLMQAKLRVNRPGDAFERQADRVADEVMRMPPGGAGVPSITDTSRSRIDREELVRRQSEQQNEEEEGVAAAKTLPGAVPTASPAVERGFQELRGGGQPLETPARSFFEPRFGRDFGAVRIHTGPRAAALATAFHARAFTVGRDVVFNRGEYAPSSPGGRRLLAHELTHVAQQGATPDRAVVRRATLGTGAGPLAHYVPVPDDEKARVTSALGLVKRVVDNPKRYPRCHRRFQTECSGPGASEMVTRFNAAVVWKRTRDEAWGGSVAPNDLAYAPRAYRWGRWMIASTVVHEMMHLCGQHSEASNLRTERICGFPGQP